MVTSAIAGAVVIGTKMYEKGAVNDAAKIQRICNNCGLKVKEGKEVRNMQLLRGTRKEWGTEYAYRIPLGLSFADFQAKEQNIADGLNHKGLIPDIRPSDLLKIELRRDILKQIQTLINRKRALRKEIELSYDGVLKIRVYEKPLPDKVPYDTTKLPLNTWKIPVGEIRGRHMIWHDFEESPHFVLGGATRYGKSNFLNMLIVTLLLTQGENVSFTLIDLKGGIEFGDYENVKQVKRIAYEPEEAREALEGAVEDMKRKQQELRGNCFRKVQEAGDKARHFIIIDEVGELNPDEAVGKEDKRLKEECQLYMSKIARLGAGLGFRQVLATQYPTGDVIPRQCKQNSDAKLCFRVQDGTASRVVLGREGAEQLPKVKGRAIYQTADERTILQTPFIKPAEIKRNIQPHITIRTRKEQPKHAESGTKRSENRKHTLVIEQTSLSD